MAGNLPFTRDRHFLAPGGGRIARECPEDLRVLISEAQKLPETRHFPYRMGGRATSGPVARRRCRIDLKVQNEKFAPRDPSVCTAESLVVISEPIGTEYPQPLLTFAHSPGTRRRAETTPADSTMILVGASNPYAQGCSAGGAGELSSVPED